MHGGVLHPGCLPFIQAIDEIGYRHIYYSASIPKHKAHFLTIINGSAATKLKSFKNIDFNLGMAKINTKATGQCWNSQHSWGVASMNLKQSREGDLVNRPSIKNENVTDGVLPQFITLSELLLEVDVDNAFYCGLTAGQE